MGKVLTAIDKSGSFRVYLGITTDVVEEARKLHSTTPLGTAALGRVLTGAGLMGLMMKEESNYLTMKFKGDGPAGSITATADGKGQVRGYIQNPMVDLPLRADGHLDVGGSLGIGQLSVSKDLGLKMPYSGQIDLVSGEIAEDISMYFYLSEQQNTSVALGVKIAKDLSVLCSGGMIIQMLPGFTDEVVDVLEQVIGQMKSMTTIIEEAMLKSKGLEQEQVLALMAESIFGGLPEEYRLETLAFRDITWHCNCSYHRMERGLIALGKETLVELMEEEPHQAELVCQFCNSKYVFDKGQLAGLIEIIDKKNNSEK